MEKFDENKLRSEIVKTWGEHGAHCEVFDMMLGKLTKLRGEVVKMVCRHEISKHEDEFVTEINRLRSINAELIKVLDNLLYELTGEQEAEDEIEKAFGKEIATRIFIAQNILKLAKGE